jgi:hypothetical protein
MDGREAPDYEKAALLLVDLHEQLDVIRYPTRARMLRAVDDAMRRDESLARLEHALRHLP